MNGLSTKTFSNYARSGLMALICGTLAGLSSALFLFFLNEATETRNHWPFLIWGLPVAGLLIGWTYHRLGGRANRGINLIIDEINAADQPIPARTGPLVLAGTLITHLFGGSAGREGTAVQMGASLADQVYRSFNTELNTIDRRQRAALLAAGAAAGFGSAIGTPWAGALFGMEMIHVGRLKLFAWYECLIASFAGYYTVVFLGAPHSHFPRVVFESLSFPLLLWMAVAGVGFGLAARFFVFITHVIEAGMKKYVSRPYLRPMIGGLILLVLYFLDGTYRFVGLGMPVINDALSSVSSIKDPLLKSFFTALTVGTGFKGGEFIPLVFIGTTLGSTLSQWLPISIGLLGRVGFAAVFAGAANTPIACTLMAGEIFGWPIVPYALVGCFVSYYISGRSGIYKSQPVVTEKPLH